MMQRYAQSWGARAVRGLLLVSVAALSACGGGGGSGDDTGALNDATDLEGTWVYATDGNTTGAACTNEPNGEDATRTTYIFTGSKYVVQIAFCEPAGLGAERRYVFMSANAGTLAIGPVLSAPLHGGQPVRALDLFSVRGNRYTAFGIAGNVLTLASDTEPGHDGLTAATRTVGFSADKNQFTKQ